MDIVCKQDSGIHDSVVKIEPHFEYVENTGGYHNFEIEHLVKKEELDDHSITENDELTRDVKELSAESVYSEDHISQDRQSKPEICNATRLCSLDQNMEGKLL